MHKTFRNCLIAVTACAFIAGCGGDGPTAEGDGRQAEGEVLEGSISDEMIPLDQLRSQGDSVAPEDADTELGGDDGAAAETDAAPSEGGDAADADAAEATAPSEAETD